jgi:hypothetical protein
VELLPEVVGKLRHAQDRFRIVTVGMKHGGDNRLGDVRRVGA